MSCQRLLLLLCFLAAVGSAAPLHAQPYERVVRDTVALTPGSVSVENAEGSITVSTWDRDTVAYEARIVSEQAPDAVENTVIEADQFNRRLSLASNFDNLEAQWSFGPEIYGYGVASPAVHYTLTVPRSAELSVDDTESTIKIDGLAAALQVNTLDSEVQVRNQRGPVRIDAQEGTVSLTDVRGDLKVDTQEGTVTVEGLRGRLMLDTHEGEADVAIDSLAATEIEAHEATVALTVPANTGFDLSADLGDGARLRGDFDFASLRDEEENNYNGRLRGGGPLLRIESHEGTTVLRTR